MIPPTSIFFHADNKQGKLEKKYGKHKKCSFGIIKGEILGVKFFHP
jgi:hypothetical protein